MVDYGKEQIKVLNSKVLSLETKNNALQIQTSVQVKQIQNLERAKAKADLDLKEAFESIIQTEKAFEFQQIKVSRYIGDKENEHRHSKTQNKITGMKHQATQSQEFLD